MYEDYDLYHEPVLTEEEREDAEAYWDTYDEAMLQAGLGEDDVHPGLGDDDDDGYDDDDDDYGYDDDYSEDMDGDFDSAMTSAGFGTDEDYNYYGGEDY